MSKDRLKYLVSFLSSTDAEVFMSQNELQELLYSSNFPIHLPTRYELENPSKPVNVRSVFVELGLIEWGGEDGYRRIKPSKADPGGIWRT